MNSLFLLLAFGTTLVAGDIFKCGTAEVICPANECCVDGNCGACPTNSSYSSYSYAKSARGTPKEMTRWMQWDKKLNNGKGLSIYNSPWANDTAETPEHRAVPIDEYPNFVFHGQLAYPDEGVSNLSKYDKFGTWKKDLTKWKAWTEAAKSNKKLHWNIIMGSMYTKHIEKEQKTLERLSNDVKSQLNSMYLGKDSGCKFVGGGGADPGCDTRTDPATCANGGDPATPPDGQCVWNGDQHKNSPIQISMQDTKLAYEALVDCLKASVNDNYYPTYLDLVQKRDPNGGIAQQVFHDQASFGEDKDLVPDSASPDTNETSDYLLLLKTKQAHYNLQSSYECSNEEMNFEVRLYKMSKLESRYKLLYLYCKCDLTSQIKKFKKMVNTICGDPVTGTDFVTGHCYSKTGTTLASEGGSASLSTTDHTDFVATIGASECNIADAFCPEHVFYYTAGGMNDHPAGECSKCVDLGGDHSNTTTRWADTANR